MPYCVPDKIARDWFLEYSMLMPDASHMHHQR